MKQESKTLSAKNKHKVGVIMYVTYGQLLSISTAFDYYEKYCKDNFLKSPLYKQESKHFYNLFAKKYKEFNFKFSDVLKDKNMQFLNKCQEYENDVLGIVTNQLEWSIKFQYDKAGINDSEVLSKIETSRILLNIAVSYIDDRITKTCNKAKVDLAPIMWLRPIDAYLSFDRLCLNLYKNKPDINLNEATDGSTSKINPIEIAVKKLQSTLYNENTIARIIADVQKFDLSSENGRD